MGRITIARTSSLVACIATGVVGCAHPATRADAPSVARCEERLPRWDPAARGAPAAVRVALSASDSRSGWDVYGGARLREALRAWNVAGLPFRLVEADTWLSADVRIVVLRDLPPDTARTGDLARYRAGFTRRSQDTSGRIVQAWVAVAERAADGEPFSVADQEGTLRHELGHALGLPHAGNALALMSPTPRVDAPTITDIRMARGLYRPQCVHDVAAARQAVLAR